MALVARQDIPIFNATEGEVENNTLSSFERDIEDAIFETIETNDPKPRMFHARKEPKTVHITQIQEQLISNQNDPSQRLSIFAKAHDEKNKKPIFSQVLLTLAICSIAVALLFPVLWFVSSQVDNLAMTSDDSVLTGSIGLNGTFSGTGDLTADPLKSLILDKPNSDKAANEGHVVRIDRGFSAGSIIYVNPN